MVKFIGELNLDEGFWYVGDYDRYHFRVNYSGDIVLVAITTVALENLYNGEYAQAFIDNIDDILAKVSTVIGSLDSMPNENDGLPVVIISSSCT